MNTNKMEILKSNPYQNDQEELSFYRKRAGEFNRIIQGDLKYTDNFSELQLEALIEITNIFTNEIKYFEECIETTPRVKKAFETIFQSKNKFYQGILKRYSTYISIICFGKIENIVYINFKTLGNEFRKGLQEVLDVVEKDIPKYELLFAELDSLQNQNKKFEVYLGRDGIYAFEGRRASDISRRRRITSKEFAERQKIKISPKYINFNTLIKEYYSEEDRKSYLESNDILPSHDLVIFDTGFTGSIPEQILKTLEFKDPDINNRIKILGTNYFTNNENIDLNEIGLEKMQRIQSRLVKGIKANYQSYLHVDIIEERPKKDMTASGIYQDDNGKLRPAEKPYFNVLFFHYELIELVIRQYFFNKK